MQIKVADLDMDEIWSEK